MNIETAKPNPSTQTRPFTFDSLISLSSSNNTSSTYNKFAGTPSTSTSTAYNKFAGVSPSSSPSSSPSTPPKPPLPSSSSSTNVKPAPPPRQQEPAPSPKPEEKKEKDTPHQRKESVVGSMFSSFTSKVKGAFSSDDKDKKSTTTSSSSNTSTSSAPKDESMVISGPVNVKHAGHIGVGAGGIEVPLFISHDVYFMYLNHIPQARGDTIPPEVKEVIVGVNDRLKALGAKRLTKREVDFVLKAALAGGIKAPATTSSTPTTTATPMTNPTATQISTNKPPAVPPKPSPAPAKTGAATGGPAKGMPFIVSALGRKKSSDERLANTGNWRQTIRPGQMQNSAELQRLRDQIQQKDTRIRELESNVRTLESKTKQIEGEIKLLRDKTTSSGDERINLEKQISELKADKAKAEAMLVTNSRQTFSSCNF